MNAKSILKKVLPIICTILLIVIITVTASAIKANSAKTPDLGAEKDEVYFSINEKLGGKDFTYKVTKGELYKDLKGQIGLSTVITMTNKAILKDAVSETTKKSYWDSVTAEEITKAINVDVYGEENVDEDGNCTITDQEEKADLEKKFTNTMYTGYGYVITTEGIYSPEVKEHYNLVLAKKLYGKEAFSKQIKEANEDEPYFDDDKVEEYYEANYGKNFYAIIVPFKSSDDGKLLLQQLGYVYNSDSSVGAWVVNTTKEKEAGSGIYESEKGTSPVNVRQVVETFIKLYNNVHANDLVEGTVTVTTSAEGATSYTFSDGCDYAVLDVEEEATAARNAIAAISIALTEEKTIEEKEELIAQAITAVTKLKAKLAEETGTQSIINKLNEVKELYKDVLDKEKEEQLISECKSIIDTYNDTTVVFNKGNKESAIYWDYAKLDEYDASFATKLESNYYTYYPFYNGAKENSVNDKNQKWYSKTPFSSSSVYYYVIKLGEEAAPKLDDVKAEILAKLEEEAYTDTIMEEKMCQLREEYGFKVLDKELQEDYIKVCEDNKVEYKKFKKQSELIAKAEKDSFKYEITVDAFFNYMEKTLGLASAISEISTQRLLINTYFNKYYDYESKTWLGEDGKELRDNIVENIENQRMNFLSGAYASYGYDPKAMTWSDFLFNLNGVNDEYELADLMLYGNVASDYINEAIKVVTVDGEEFDEIKFDVEYKDALASNAWKLLEARMKDVYKDAFNVTGEHLLVKAYETFKDSLSSDATPLDPVKWTAEQKALAKELIEDVYDYMQYAEGSIATKLKAVVDAFDSAPYNVEDEHGKDVLVVNSDNQPYKYVLKYANDKCIDLAKYKSAGLHLAYESLGAFGAGKMVKPFEEAVKSIWLADKAAGELTDNITIYEITEGTDKGKHYIETEFGYHLYVNLSSTFNKEYEVKTLDDNGNVVSGAKQIIPSLYEIRLNNLINAYNGLITEETSDADKEKINKKVEELKENLSEDAQAAIKAYYDEVSKELVGSYFSTMLQQNEIKALVTNDNFTLGSGAYKKEDIIKLIETNEENTFESNIKYLKAEDLDSFNITKAFVDANK